MVYAVLVASAFLIEVALNMPLGSLPLALIHAHVPAGQIALVLGAGPLAALVVSVPIGGLADRFGRLPAIRIAACLCVVSVGALAYVHDPILTGLIMAIRSIAITAYVTAEFAYASAVVAPERAVSATATLGMVRQLEFCDRSGGGFLALAARDRARAVLVVGRSGARRRAYSVALAGRNRTPRPALA
jgi:MFS family permease